MENQEQTNAQTHKLSALMRTGATLHEQGKGGYITSTPLQGVIATCAIGAAYEALNPAQVQRDRSMNYTDAMRMFNICNIPNGQKFEHPIDHTQDSLHDAITNLNDDLGWTREEIADWLEEEGL